MGDDEEAAAHNPFLMVYDGGSESMFVIALSSKEYKEWIVQYIVAILSELGYGGTRIAIKCDQAPELQKIRREIAARRASATVPLDVPVKESKGNGAVEKAIRTWQGQFRTLKDHLEYMIDAPLGPRQPVLTWCAWWAALLLNLVRVTPNGRTPWEMVCGHRARTPLAIFGEKVLVRQARKVSGRGKFDSEWEEGIFLGISGPETVVATEDGVIRSRDIRRLADGQQWDKAFIDAHVPTFKDYLQPDDGEREVFDIPVMSVPPEVEPDPIELGPSRRMMLRPADFVTHGFTDGCPGCVAIRAGRGSARRHSEPCRTRIEAEIIKTPEGQIRKDREATRREVEFNRAVEHEEANLPPRQPEPPRAPEPPRPPEASASRPPPEPEPDGYEPVIDPEFDDLLQGIIEKMTRQRPQRPQQAAVVTLRGGVLSRRNQKPSDNDQDPYQLLCTTLRRCGFCR